MDCMPSESNPDGFSKGLVSDVVSVLSTALECRTSRSIVITYIYSSATFVDLSWGWFPDDIDAGVYYREVLLWALDLVLEHLLYSRCPFPVIFSSVLFPSPLLHGANLPFFPSSQGTCMYHHHRRLVTRVARVYHDQLNCEQPTLRPTLLKGAVILIYMIIFCYNSTSIGLVLLLLIKF